MTSRKARSENITEYINAAPRKSRKKLREMRACIRAAAPGAKESLKWGMPAFSYQRILVTFAALKHHIGFYPTSSPMKVFSERLTNYKTSKGAIQFPINEAIPLTLVKDMVKFRIKENLEKENAKLKKKK